jgi:predicted HD superfamily hydrolase involved in NAD metabolism
VSLSPEMVGRARDLVVRRLSPEAYAHCERTGTAAAALAERFGVDVVDAEVAGLLHDYAREEDEAGLVGNAERLGGPVLPFERAHPDLLHARVGAAQLRRDLPGLGEAVLSAIEVHTVGAIPMSDLDKVVYLADMTEPDRDYPGLDDLRAELMSETLDECFRLAYGRTLRHLKESGRPVHPISNGVAAQIERETGRPLFDPPVVAR